MSELCVCPRCKKRVLDRSDCGESGLFQSNHLICNSCFEDEDNEIWETGTNDIPETLNSYGPANI